FVQASNWCPNTEKSLQLVRPQGERPRRRKAIQFPGQTSASFGSCIYSCLDLKSIRRFIKDVLGFGFGRRVTQSHSIFENIDILLESGFSKNGHISELSASIYSMYSQTMDTTLDAWEILQTIVQLGGFAPAAKKLNRSQSTISYAIGRLQEQLGVRLFEIHGRKAQLTEAGRVLLADVEPHLEGFHELEQRARVMASGGASEIRISVDSIFPDHRLFEVLAVFSRSFPHVRLRLRQGTFLSADTEFSVHNAQICVTDLVSREILVKPILVIAMIAVVRRDHPLLKIRRRLSRSDLMQQILVIIEGAASGNAT